LASRSATTNVGHMPVERDVFGDIPNVLNYRVDDS
jgi:hypothetical protein